MLPPALFVPAQVKALLAGALAVAVCVISANKSIHDGLSSLLTKQERVEGDALARWLENVEVSGAARHSGVAVFGAQPTCMKHSQHTCVGATGVPCNPHVQLLRVA
jgi:hypothetical protein